MSVRYRQAFRETLCCCLLDQPQSRRSTMEYTYIKSMNRQRSTDIPGYFKNGTLRRSYDKDDSHAGIQLLQNESNMPIQNGGGNSSCPTCKYGSSKDVRDYKNDPIAMKKLYMTDNAVKFSRIGTHV